MKHVELEITSKEMKHVELKITSKAYD